jgi:hypothetical protein
MSIITRGGFSRIPLLVRRCVSLSCLSVTRTRVDLSPNRESGPRRPSLNHHKNWRSVSSKFPLSIRPVSAMPRDHSSQANYEDIRTKHNDFGTFVHSLATRSNQQYAITLLTGKLSGSRFHRGLRLQDSPGNSRGKNDLCARRTMSTVMRLRVFVCSGNSYSLQACLGSLAGHPWLGN